MSSLTTTTPVLSIVDGHPTTTSNEVAAFFGKDHAKVLRDVRTLTEQCEQKFNEANFGLVEYTDAKGERRPAYRLTRDGFTLLAMGFTGKKALQFKLAYIDAFNKMEAALTPKALPSGPILVSPEQKAKIKEAVLRKAERLGVHYQATWRNFYTTFEVHSYHVLPASKYEAAMEWLGVEARQEQKEPPQLSCGILTKDSALGVITRIDGGRGNCFGYVHVDFGITQKQYKVNHLIWKELTVGQPVRFEFTGKALNSDIRKVEPLPLFIPMNDPRFQIAMGSAH